jgi:hypothetical protein
MKSELAEAIVQLLPHVQAVLAVHDPRRPARRRCHRCPTSECAECAEFWLAAAALDLVICARRNEELPAARPAHRWDAAGTAPA